MHALPPNVTAQLQKDRTKVPDADPRRAPFRFEQRLRSRFTSCVVTGRGWTRLWSMNLAPIVR
jgi:hypothetical protein